MTRILHFIGKVAIVGGVVVLVSGCVRVPLQSSENAPLRPIHLSVVHEVQPGETLEDIANNFSTTPAAIAAANNLPSFDTPPVGTELRIPRKTLSTATLRHLVQDPARRLFDRTHLLPAVFRNSETSNVDAQRRASGAGENLSE